MKLFTEQLNEFYTFDIFSSCILQKLQLKYRIGLSSQPDVVDKENRIYFRGEFTRKKCKTAIFVYCFHTAGVLHIFMPYNLLGPGISFYRKSQINMNQIMK